MSPSLFRPGPDPRSTPGTTRLSALPVSMAVHVLVVLAVVVIPLLATDVLPLPNHPLESWMPVAPVPVPPPPPPPAVVSRPVPALVASNPDAAPPVAPTGFAPDDGLDRTALPQAHHLPPGVIQGEEGGKGLAEVAPPPPPPPTREPVRVGPSIKQPSRLVDVRPVYPEVARQARVEGVVIIEAVIGPTGDVQSARVLRSQPLLDEAALAAVRQWKFTPTLLNGVPVPVVMTVTVNFRLQ
jgi:periplasmic protein TonB